MILLNDGWMVDLAMGSFGILTIFLIYWHPWDLWICIRSVCCKWNLKQVEAIPPNVAIYIDMHSLLQRKIVVQSKFLLEQAPLSHHLDSTIFQAAIVDQTILCGS